MDLPGQSTLYVELTYSKSCINDATQQRNLKLPITGIFIGG
jgi:hypothetical protein